MVFEMVLVAKFGLVLVAVDFDTIVIYQWRYAKKYKSKQKRKKLRKITEKISKNDENVFLIN